MKDDAVEKAAQTKAKQNTCERGKVAGLRIQAWHELFPPRANKRNADDQLSLPQPSGITFRSRWLI